MYFVEAPGENSSDGRATAGRQVSYPHMPSVYPWGALEPMSRSAHRLASGARRRLSVSARGLGDALAELLELPCEVVLRRSSAGVVAPSERALWFSGDRALVGVEAEPALAAFLAARILRRSEPLADPREPLPPALNGLLAALTVEAARRSGSPVPLRLLDVPPVGEEATLVEVTLILEGRPFSLKAWVVATAGEAPRPRPLSDLGSLVLSLPLVVASLSLERREFATLEVGAALLIPAGLGLNLAGVGRCVLVAPASERAIGVELHADGRLVVGEPTQARLSVESEEEGPTEAVTLSEVLLDAPLVVRIELGAVSMTAREWAALGPGDVIEAAQRVAEPVVLRVAGREVGRGELINIDGQVGVRIQKLLGDGS